MRTHHGEPLPYLLSLFAAFLSVLSFFLPHSFNFSSPEQLYVPYLWALVCYLHLCVCVCVCSVCFMFRRRLCVSSTSAADNTAAKYTHTLSDTEKTYKKIHSNKTNVVKPVSQDVKDYQVCLLYSANHPSTV